MKEQRALLTIQDDKNEKSKGERALQVAKGAGECLAGAAVCAVAVACMPCTFFQSIRLIQPAADCCGNGAKDIAEGCGNSQPASQRMV